MAAEAVRYLNYAAPRGGITEPATVATVTASLLTAAYRLPAAIGDWIQAEASAGRIADDHQRPTAQLTALIRAAIRQASDQAEDLAAAADIADNLTATLHTADPAAPAA